MTPWRKDRSPVQQSIESSPTHDPRPRLFLRHARKKISRKAPLPVPARRLFARSVSSSRGLEGSASFPFLRSAPCPIFLARPDPSSPTAELQSTLAEAELLPPLLVALSPATLRSLAAVRGATPALRLARSLQRRQRPDGRPLPSGPRIAAAPRGFPVAL